MSITRSPLCWPAWFPRTPNYQRKHGHFGTKNRERYGKSSITIPQATSRIFEQIRGFSRVGQPYRAHPDDVIISSDLELRNDGLPRGGQRAPSDPGVAVYFQLDEKDRVIPCDMYLRIEDNMAAIAATLEALRTIERHGSQMFEAAFTGFDALPSPDHVMGRSWRDVLDYYGDSLAKCKACYFRARKAAHPDHGGSTDKFNEVETAWAQAQEALK